MDARRLDDLFGAALSIPPAQRAVWADAHCGGDAELRRELMRLLEADAHAEGVLESGPDLIAEVLDDGDPPQAFGVWRVLGRLGAGGMGEVWLGERDDAGFTQRAAIKQVAWPTPGLLQRFQRERQILARLQHPGIAHLIDGGVDDAGRPYLAMEHVEGERIDAWVRDHALDVRTTVELLLKVCDAVQYAHRNLVVHSDIKPSNILVGADGAPRLLDFGIAKVLSDEGADATGTGARMLTPDYAAPELVAGGSVTTAVDVYALGVLAYELLAGVKPPRANVAVPSDAVPLRPPSASVPGDTVDRRARRHGLRGDLDRVVTTAMAADPSRRYASVEAFARDLGHWLEGRPVAAHGPGAWYRVRKFVRRNRVAVVAALVAVLSLAAATVYSIDRARIARAQMHRAEAVRRFLDNTFAQFDPSENRGKPMSMRDALEHSEARLARARDMPLSVRADLTALIGKLYWNIADNTAAERALKTALSMAQDGAVPAQVKARALLALATVESDRSDGDSAYRHATQALALAGEGDDPDRDFVESARRLVASLAIDHDGAARAEPLLRAQLASDRARHGDSQAVIDDLIMLGRALEALARHGEAETTLSEAVAMARRVKGPYYSSLGLALDYLGVIRMHRGDYAGASQAFAESGKVTETLWGADNVRTSITREQRLEVAVLEGRFGEVLPAVSAMRDEAASLREARPDHHAASSTLLGDALRGLGRFDKAEAAYRVALTLWSEVPQGSYSAGMADTLSALATTLRWQGRLEEAGRAVRQAIDIDRADASHAAAPQPDLPALARDLSMLAQITGLRGDHPQALRLAREAMAVLPRGRGDESPVSTLVQARLAQALLDNGDADAALVQAREALAVADRVLPPDNWQRAVPLLVLGRAELAAGRPTRAANALRRTLALRQPLYPPGDPRTREIQLELDRALRKTTPGGNGEAPRG